MTSIDGSEHARLRRIIAHTFTASRIAALAPDKEKPVGRHLDDIKTAGPART